MEEFGIAGERGWRDCNRRHVLVGLMTIKSESTERHSRQSRWRKGGELAYVNLRRVYIVFGYRVVKGPRVLCLMISLRRLKGVI